YELVASPMHCTIQNNTCPANFESFGEISNQGHYTPNLNSSYTFQLCCQNLANVGKGAVSFKYSPNMSPILNGSGHVSINSTYSNFYGWMRLGFQDSCYISSTCNATSEVCIFRVGNEVPANRINASNPYAIDNSQITSCNSPSVPFVSNFTKKLCCKFQEICNDGVDNDVDDYIDCADNDCNNWTPSNPKYCTGSPLDSDACVISYTSDGDGNINVVYNSSCQDQPPINYPDEYYYCSYPRDAPAQGAPGMCCPIGTYPRYTTFTGWYCEDSALCGIGSGTECLYDFDTERPLWRASVYNPSNPDTWCQSKLPYFFSPIVDYMLYPERSTGCCLLNKDGTVGYFTDEENVKIFGIPQVCGDNLITPPEFCDGWVNGTCEDYGVSCTGGTVLTGAPSCSSNCMNVDTTTCTCSLPMADGEPYYID
ncbi:MAG: hypothetical protein ACP5N3_05805, partial [Candidatus Nanoarchaeia archaeon]